MFLYQVYKKSHNHNLLHVPSNEAGAIGLDSVAF